MTTATELTDDPFAPDDELSAPSFAPGETRVVRIKPLNPKTGNKTRQYLVNDLKFVLGNWYVIDAALGEYLRDVTPDTHPDSPRIFDVLVDKEEAREIVAREERARRERGVLQDHGNVFTNDDLRRDIAPRPHRRRPAPTGIRTASRE